MLARIITALVLLCSANLSHAAGCDSPGTAVLVFNGVHTTIAGAYKNLRAVREVVGLQIEGQHVPYHLMYNPTDSILDDLLEAARQLATDNSPIPAWTPIAVVGESATRQLIGGGGIFNYNIALRNAILTSIVNLVTRGEEASVTAKFLETATILRDQKHYRLLFVAHSQGNLYSHAVYDGMKKIVAEPYIRVINVANPSRRTTVSGDENFSSTEDVVVVQSAGIPGKLTPKNVTASDLLDPLGHSFANVYMNAVSGVGDAVIAAITSKLKDLTALKVLDAKYCPAAKFWEGSFQYTTCNAPGSITSGDACNFAIFAGYGNSQSNRGQILFRSDSAESNNVRINHFTGGNSQVQICAGFSSGSVLDSADSFVRHQEFSGVLLPFNHGSQPIDIVFTITSRTEFSISGGFSVTFNYPIGPADSSGRYPIASGSAGGVWSVTRRETSFPKCVVSPPGDACISTSGRANQLGVGDAGPCDWKNPSDLGRTGEWAGLP